ncbi:AAA-ATPase ASD, mitochondrial [Linum perenne]
MIGQLSSYLPTLFLLCTMFHRNLPRDYRNHIGKFLHKFLSFLYPYIEVTFHEYSDDYHHRRNTIYASIENYLSSKSIQQARSLKADSYKGNHKLRLSMDDHQEVTDHFRGVNLLWTKESSTSKSYFSVKKKFYKLTFNRKHRDFVTGDYIKHVIEEGNAIELHNRQRKLHANGSRKTHGGSETASWSHILFNHPASFQTLAIDPEKKKEILEDLITFSQAEEFYARIGRAWKRGYLLYGPPGTGKSTMIAAIANLLNYDIYDLELTAVKDNTELRKLLIETSSKSVVVIEDIDCSLDLTGQRRKTNDKEEATDEKDQKPKQPKEDREAKPSQVTLSGLLNFIDGLWSACGGERLIVFTTNHVEKLDPALIRKGRMDKHIELSYCSFEAFRVLAKNYLLLHDHQLFDKIRQLLLETKMTPADVAEHLMPKTVPPNPEVCLNSLVQSLEAAQEEAREKNSEKEISAIEDTKEENKEAPAGTGRDESKYKQQ